MQRIRFRQIRPFVIGWCICLLAMELLGARIISSGSSVDFQLFYVAGYQVRTHPSQMYDLAQQDKLQRALTYRQGSLPFLHPSYEAFFYAPLSLLKFRYAYFISIAISMLLLMAAFFAARDAFSSIIPLFQPRPGLVFFTFIPLFVVLVLGQDSALCLLLLCLTWRELESGNDVSAGCYLGLAMFKFQIVIPIALLLAAWRGWRFTKGYLLTSASVALLCFGIVGRLGVKAYMHLLLGAAYVERAGLTHRMAVAFAPDSMPNLAGLIYSFGARFMHSAFAYDALVAVCSVALFLYCAIIIRRTGGAVAFSVAVICGLLLSFHLMIYDLTLLLLPITLTAHRVHRYILMCLIVLPFVTTCLGPGWIFIIGVPTLAMLANLTVSAQKPVASAPDFPGGALA